MNKFYFILASLLLVVSTVSIWFRPSSDVSVQGISDSKCTVSSTKIATVGDDISSTILAANENRAYARIQQLNNATNTVSLSFDEGAAAVLNQGVVLGDEASTTVAVEFGRNADFPYTGAVTGITNIGSTTVLVTECTY